jgi:hypothetical protein
MLVDDLNMPTILGICFYMINQNLKAFIQKL